MKERLLMSPRQSIWLTASALAFAVVIAHWLSGPRISKDLNDPVVVDSSAVARRIVATGTLEPKVTVQVGAEISGTVDALYADYNSVVHKGQILAKLDPALLEAQVREAQAMLDEARASLAQARADGRALDKRRRDGVSVDDEH
jgi:HlyD family secretion protein